MNRRTILGAACLSLVAKPVLAATPPQRIVSLNPCLDAILVRIAPRHQIAAISHYSRIAQQSNIHRLALTLPITYESAEEIVALRPDMVLTSQHSSRATRQALERLGIPVERFAVPQTVDESLEQLIRIGDLLGRPQRALALKSEIQTAIDQHAIPRSAKRFKAVIFQPNGFAAGQGTLMSEMMQRAGLDNVAGRYGIGKWGNLPIEGLLADPPDVILSGSGSAGARSWAERVMLHPSLRALSSRVVQASLPERLLYCGGPVLIETAAALKRAHAHALEALA